MSTQKGERACEPGSLFVSFLVRYQKTISLRTYLVMSLTNSSITILRACSVVPQTSRGLTSGISQIKSLSCLDVPMYRVFTRCLRCVNATRTYIYLYISLRCTYVYICTMHNVRRRAKNTLYNRSSSSRRRTEWKWVRHMAVGLCAFGSPRTHICPWDFVARYVSLLKGSMGSKYKNRQLKRLSRLLRCDLIN